MLLGLRNGATRTHSKPRWSCSDTLLLGARRERRLPCLLLPHRNVVHADGGPETFLVPILVDIPRWGLRRPVGKRDRKDGRHAGISRLALGVYNWSVVVHYWIALDLSRGATGVKGQALTMWKHRGSADNSGFLRPLLHCRRLPRGGRVAQRGREGIRQGAAV